MNDEELRYRRAKARVKSIRGFYSHATVYLVINLVLILFKFIDGPWRWGFHYQDWYLTPLLWGIGLLFHFLSVFVFKGFFGAEWEERKIKEYMDRKR